MESLIQLRLELDAIPQPIEGHDEFIRLAAEQGLRITTVRVPGKVGDRLDTDLMYEQIENAKGYWIRNPVLLEDQRTMEILERRLQQGAMAFWELRWNSNKGRDLATELGVEPTSVRAMRAKTTFADAQLPDMLMTIAREEYPSAFRDASLFRGVDELLLQQANGIGCLGPNVQPVLSLPSEAVTLLDMKTDLFVKGFSRPELPVLVDAARPSWKGRILGSAVGLIHDAYHGPFGDFFPGIQGSNNRRFAENLIRTILSGAPAPLNGWDRAFQLIESIERPLAQTTAEVLAGHATAQWFLELVPAEIQDKCQARADAEGSAFPVASYLDLIDFKKIWKRHWNLFDPYISQVSPNELGKSSFLSMIQKVNEVRKPTVHVTRRALGDIHPPDPRTMDELDSFARLLSALYKAVTSKGP